MPPLSRNSTGLGAGAGWAAGAAGAGPASGFGASCARAAAATNGTRAEPSRRMGLVLEVRDDVGGDVRDRVHALDGPRLRDEVVRAVLGGLLDGAREALRRLAEEQLVLRVAGLEALVEDLLVLVDLRVDLVEVHLGGLRPRAGVAVVD